MVCGSREVQSGLCHLPTTDAAVCAVIVMVVTWGEETVTLVAMGVVTVMVLAILAHTVTEVVCKGDMGRFRQGQGL